MPTHASLRRALTVGSSLALAAGLASAAPAQSFEGAPTTVSGSVAIDRMSTPSTDIVTVSSPTAVIDWAPYDTNGSGVINFQGPGTTAIFQNNAGGNNFTVLNRIVPTDATRPIAFNGNVVSQLRNAGGVAARGGSVWFYSPGGIVIADGAVFDIGSLLLTTADPTGRSGTIASTTSFALDSAGSPNGIVNVLSGATINATNSGSYVAMVAPIVFQAGTVNVNGAAAYVAAEQATLTLAQGLFTIDVTVGSSAAAGFPLQHRGTTRFPDSTGQRRAYLVSVPKNDAITLVVESAGKLGFDVATQANIQNGAVILSAGPRQVGDAAPAAPVPTAVAANLAINGGAFNAPVRAVASDTATIRTVAPLSFASNLTVLAGGAAPLGGSIVTQNVTAGGSLTFTANTGGISTGALSAAGITLTSSGSGIGTGALTSTAGITLNAGQVINTGALRATTRIAATGGALTTTDVESTGGTIGLVGTQSLTTGNIRAAGSIALTSAGAIRAGDVTAGTGPLAAGAAGLLSGSDLVVPTGIATGFTGGAISRCDDCFGLATALGFTINYFGRTYSQTFVSNNGYVTFNSGQGSYSPLGLGATYNGQPIIAAFYADVDTTNMASAQTMFGTGTYGGRSAFAATWDGVGYFSGRADKLNNFQIILADRSDTGAGNFDIFYNYTRIQWETGSVNGGVNGLGGSSASAGFNAGTGNQPGTFFSFPGSLVNGAFLDGGPNSLAAVNGTGQASFAVRNGTVIAGSTEAPTIRINNTGAAAGSAPAITTGALTAEAVEVNGAGQVTTGAIRTADLVVDGTPGIDPLRTIVTAGSGITTGAIDSGGLITLTATRGDIFNAAANGVGAITLTANGGVTLNGAVSGPTVAITSSDIAIASGATVTGATALTLTALSPGVVATIGGTGPGAQGGYTLDAAEAARLRSASIRIAQQGRPAGDAQMILRDLTLNGSDAAQGTANLISSAGTLAFAATGTIRVTGNVRVNSAAAGNTLSFTTGESFNLVNDTGSVGLFAGGGGLGGRLLIDAAGIAVVNAALFARAAPADANGFFSAEMLGALNGAAATPRAEGVLQANRIELTAATFVAIQNTGTLALPAGFSAGAGGLAITRRTGASTPLALAINGRIAGADGAFRTGGATGGLVTFNSGAQSSGLNGFDPRSTVNGCAIGSSCLGVDLGQSPVVVVIAPNILGALEVIASSSTGDSGGGVASLPTVGLVGAIDTASLNTDSIITDPVAAGGNPALWSTDDQPSEEERRRRQRAAAAAGNRP